jgi:hypothetical protein
MPKALFLHDPAIIGGVTKLTWDGQAWVATLAAIDPGLD